MIIVLDRDSMSRLQTFLLAEFRKRRGDDDFFAVREWAREIDIPNSTLGRYMNSVSGNVEMTPRNLAKLVDYFGEEFLDVLGVRIPKTPRNPKYGKG